MTHAPYKLLIRGTLVQQTAFSTGGNREENSKNADIDNLLAKDGEGRFTLRGTSLAGAFIATANQLYKKVPLSISEGSPANQEPHNDNLPRMKESLWIFHHAHPVNTPANVEIRDNVAIRQKTGAAKDGAKFDSEILPAGTRWDFLMEVDEYRYDPKSNDSGSKSAASIALNVSKAWEQQCWLGRDVARGLGWMRLENLKIYKLTTEHIYQWPDSGKTPCEPLQALSKTVLNPGEIQKIRQKHTPDKEQYSQTGTITLTVGKNNDGYGLDMLSVGGNNSGDSGKEIEYPKHLQGKAFVQKHKDNLIMPLGQNKKSYLSSDKGKKENSENNIDFNLATTQKADGTLIPYIPGSSIRGPMRHTLSWLLRKNGATIWEPAGEIEYPKKDKDDIAITLFGSTQKSARLLISDAFPIDNNWQMVVLEMHAEDEFTQSVYGSGKFDRTCLTHGTFKASFHLQASSPEELKEMKQELDKLKQLGQQHMIPIGGGQWKGIGWIQLDLSFSENAQTQTGESK